MSYCYEDSKASFSSLIDVLQTRAAQQPQATAFSFLGDDNADEISVTYGALEQQARTIATVLANDGGEGERVLLLYPPGLDYIAAVFGCIYAGATAVPAYPPKLNRSLSKIQSIVTDAQPTLALTTTSILSMLAPNMQSMGDLTALRWIATDNLPLSLAESWRAPVVRSNSLAFLQYTSGSTATPKGVILTPGNVLQNLALIQQCFGTTTRSRAIFWLPFYHDMGLGGLLQTVYCGGTAGLMPPVSFLRNPYRWLKAVSSTEATISGGPNFAYDLCVRKITPEQRANLDLSAWEVAFCGAEPIRPATLEQFATTFKDCGFRKNALYPCYGLSEATLIVTGGKRLAGPAVRAFDRVALEQNHVVEVAATDDRAHLIVNCGSILPQGKICIINPDSCTTQRSLGCRAGSGEVGEIWISGPSVAQGYWNRREETEETFYATVAQTDGGEDGPYLRTGDLGFLLNNELFVTGRLKDLVIIRGRNHYPQDIEITTEQTNILLRPGCGAAFSVTHAGEEQLVVVHEIERQARRLDTVETIVQDIRRAVAEQHGVTAYAVVLVSPGTIPRTSSGKVQRYACRTAYLSHALNVVGESVIALNAISPIQSLHPSPDLLEVMDGAVTRARVESLVRALASRALLIPSMSDADVQQPLTALGLDSLTAAELQCDIENAVGATVPTVALLDGWSVSRTAAHLFEQLSRDPDSIQDEVGGQKSDTTSGFLLVRGADESLVPLSFNQERLWFLDRLNPGNPAYNIPVAMRLHGQLDVMALERSLTNIMHRHDSLRTTFVSREGQLLQRIGLDVSATLSVIDLRGLPKSLGSVSAQSLTSEIARHPFDLARGPLFRASLLRLGDEDHVLVMSMHHIVCDLWSVLVLVRDLVAYYDAASAGRVLPISPPDIRFADFVAWQRGRQDDIPDEHLSYWKQQLQGAPTLALPSDRGEPSVRSFRGGSIVFEIEEPTAHALRKFSRQENVTLFMTLVAAFEIVLYRYTGDHDITIGTPVSGRVHPGLRDIVGFFAYPLALRVNLSGNPTFREIVRRVREVALAAYAHQDVPFAKVVETLRLTGQENHNPLFRVMLGFLDREIVAAELPHLSIIPVDVERRATDIDLFLSLIKSGEGLHGVLEYNADLFSAEAAEGLVAWFHDVLEQYTRFPNSTLSASTLTSGPTSEDMHNRSTKSGQLIAMAATFTAQPVEESLHFWMQKLGVNVTIEHAPYNQVLQQLLNPSSLLSRNGCGINAILIRFEDWYVSNENDKRAIVALPEDAYHTIAQSVQDFVRAVTAAAEGSVASWIVCICPPSDDANSDPRYQMFCQKMEEQLVAALDGVGRVQIITPSMIQSFYPVARYYDAVGDELGFVPFTPLFFTALGTMMSRAIVAHRDPFYKVVVLDGDHTLWRGTCAEDGASGVVIDAPHRALQEFMVAQHNAGMLICVCSRNNERDIVEVFDAHPDMPLRRDYIISWRINWLPKSQNIRSLGNELGLGLESFIFIDDDPVECAEVRAHCPEVLTIPLPYDAANIPLFLKHVWAFDHVGQTEEDRVRTALYRQNQQRALFQQEAVSLSSFLTSLRLEVQIARLDPSQVARVVQLMHRTNQFNSTAQKLSDIDLLTYCHLESHDCLTVAVRDRFGDYGTVGAVIAEQKGNILTVDSFMLSCRSLGRGVEHRMLAALAARADERGCHQVDVLYIPTERNELVGTFLNGVGVAYRQPHPRGWLYRFPVVSIIGLVYDPVSTIDASSDVLESAGSGMVPSSTHSVHKAAQGVELLEQIASQLDTVEHILATIRSNKCSRPELPTAFVAPRNATEEKLVLIWSDTLGITDIGIQDDFFDLGGHSLQGIQIVTTVHDAFHVDLPLEILFSGALTIEKLGKAITQLLMEQLEANTVDDLLTELDGLSDDDVRVILAKEGPQM